MTDLFPGDLRPRVRYLADGATHAFAFPFRVLDADDLNVRVGSLAQPPAHAISGIGAPEGGEVVFAAPPAAGADVVLWRSTPLVRSSSFLQAGELRAAALNGEFDRLVLMLQDLAARLEEALLGMPGQEGMPLRLPPPEVRRDRLLGFDAAGAPAAVAPPGMEGLAALIQASVETGAARDAAVQAQQGALDAQTAAEAARDQAMTAFLPAGTLVDWAGTTLPPRWLRCAGQNVGRAAYPALFAAIGTTYGPGDGGSTFGLPDLRGRVVAGRDDMGGVAAGRLTDLQILGLGGPTALGNWGGAELVTLTVDQMPEHGHVLAGPTGGESIPAFGATGAYSDQGQYGSNARVSGATLNAGAGHPHGNVQPTIVLDKIIYAGV